MALGSEAYVTGPNKELASTQGVYTADMDYTNPNSGSYRPITYLPGVSDASLLDKFKAVFSAPADSGLIIGGAGPDMILNSAASQDVPQGGDTRLVTDYTATTATPATVAEKPGVFRLMWNSITGSGPGLFSCREDSIICAGTGTAAKDAQMTTPNQGAGPTNWLGSLQSTLIITVIGLVLLLVVIKRLTPA